jgi:hypothetical protein
VPKQLYICYFGSSPTTPPTVNRYKKVYPYFYCLSRQQGQACKQSYIPVELVEQAIAKQFRTIKLTAADRIALQKEVKSQLRYDITDGKSELTRQEKRMTRLLMERQRILQAFYEDEISSSMLGNEQKRIDKEIAELKEIVDEATKVRKAARKNYDDAIELATTLNLEAAYLKAHPLMRRRLDQSVFAEVRIDDTKVAMITDDLRQRMEHDVRVLGIKQHTKIDHARLAQEVVGLTMSKTELT